MTWHVFSANQDIDVISIEKEGMLN